MADVRVLHVDDTSSLRDDEGDVMVRRWAGGVRAESSHWLI
jgi:hypothetical protein